VGGDHREFAPLAARAPDGTCMLSVDLPGYGQSPKPAQWSIETIVGELRGELENIPISRGRLSVLQRRDPGAARRLGASDRVRRVVIIDPFAFIHGICGFFWLVNSAGELITPPSRPHRPGNHRLDAQAVSDG